MSLKIYNIGDRTYKFRLTRKMYSREAVLNTSYKFLDKAYFSFGDSDDSCVDVIFEIKKNIKCNPEYMIKEFYNELIDQQIRCDLDIRVGKIRELIYDKAFSALR